MQFTTLLAVVVASAQLIMAAPVETAIETAPQLATTTPVSPSTAAAASAVVTTSPYFIKNINSALSSSSSPSTSTSPTISTSSSPSSASTSTSSTTSAAVVTQQAMIKQRGVDHSKKLTEYLDYSTSKDDKLPECYKKCILESSGKKGDWGMTVDVMDTTVGDFCNYEIRTSEWIRKFVLTCTDSACEADQAGSASASRKWMGNVCPGKYGN
ncbi:hypothetical protein RB596_009262 [Gaeumannomyces avenae]